MPAKLGLSDEELAEHPTVFASDALKGQVVVVSGAAGGIGRAIAFLFARLGAHVVAVGRNQDTLETLVGAMDDGIALVYAGIRRMDERGRTLGTFSPTAARGMLLDPLSMVFVLLITGVGSLIHIYAVGYMAHDPGRRRFFGYFNFFVGVMLH